MRQIDPSLDFHQAISLGSQSLGSGSLESPSIGDLVFEEYQNIDVVLYDLRHQELSCVERLIQNAYFSLKSSGTFLCFLDLGCDPSKLVQTLIRGGFKIFQKDPLLNYQMLDCHVLMASRVQRNTSYLAARLPDNPTAMVFNNHFRTAGGGERSSLDYASALRALGFRIILATDHRIEMNLEEITKPFGIEFDESHWKLEQYPGIEALQREIQEKKISVFVNHTYGSWVKNYALLGIYCVMFPHDFGRENTFEREEIANIRTYNRIHCNSKFTEQYVHQFWAADLPTKVFVPPISKSHTYGLKSKFEDKEKIILNIGRFNVFGHEKHQLKAIETFVDGCKRGDFDPLWKLLVIGRVNEGRETHKYVEECRKTAKGYNIEIIVDASFEYIIEAYQRASYLWQFTGYGLEFGEKPDQCEHLGLVVLDCFSYGVLPLVYQRGGAALLLKHGEDGFVFRDSEDLLMTMKMLISEHGSFIHRRRFRRSQERFEEFRFEAFRGRLEHELCQFL